MQPQPAPEFLLPREIKDSPDGHAIIRAAAGFVNDAEAAQTELPDIFHQFLSLDIYVGRSENSGHRALMHTNYLLPAFTQTCASMARHLDLGDLTDSILAFEAFALQDHVQAQATDLANFQPVDPKLQQQFEVFDQQQRAANAPPDVILADLSAPESTKNWLQARFHDHDEIAPYYLHAAAWLFELPDDHFVPLEQYQAARDLLQQRRAELSKQRQNKSRPWLHRLFGKRS